MILNILFIGPSSVSIELVNEDIYYTKSPYNVWLDGSLVLQDQKTNVFSLYGLLPDTTYEIRINDQTVIIHTRLISARFNIKTFINDGKDDDTLAFQAAIMMLPKDGLLYVPAGEYHVKSLFLKSDMTLELDKGATIYASGDISSYPITPGEVIKPDGSLLQLATWEGNTRRGRTSFISAYHAKNVNIVGLGTLNGCGEESGMWKIVKKIDYAPMRLIFLNDCDGVTIQGVTVTNSASWTIHPYFSRNLGFYDINIKNPKISSNTDGLDPEACDNVNIIGVKFSVGDDCIALKSNKIRLGNIYKTPTSRVLIRNCLMADGHGAITLGSEISAGINDIDVSRCLFLNTDRGLRIKTRRGRGNLCVIDGVKFKNIKMEHVKCPLVINMFYFCDPDGHDEIVWSKEKHPIDEGTPHMGSFVFEDIEATDCHYAIAWFAGLPEQKIDNVTIRNSTFTVAKEAESGRPAMMDDVPDVSKLGMIFYNVEKVILDNVKVSGQEGPLYREFEVGEIEVK